MIEATSIILNPFSNNLLVASCLKSWNLNPLIFVFLHVLSHKLLTVVLFKGKTLPLIVRGNCFKTLIALALYGIILFYPFLV